MTKLAEEAFGAEVSPGLVSQLLKDLDPAVEAFNTRPFGRYRYILVDARFDKVREGKKKVVSRAFLWAMGVNEEGEREVLGFLDWGGETEVAWEAFFVALKRRGLNGVELLVSDAHEGLGEAALKAFPGSSWPECQAHFLRRAIEEVRKDDQKAFHNDVRMILQAADREECDDQLKRLQGRLSAAPRGTLGPGVGLDCKASASDEREQALELPTHVFLAPDRETPILDQHRHGAGKAGESESSPVFSDREWIRKLAWEIMHENGTLNRAYDGWGARVVYHRKPGVGWYWDWSLPRPQLVPTDRCRLVIRWKQGREGVVTMHPVSPCE